MRVEIGQRLRTRKSSELFLCVSDFQPGRNNKSR